LSYQQFSFCIDDLVAPKANWWKKNKERKKERHQNMVDEQQQLQFERERERDLGAARFGMQVWVQVRNRLRKRILVSSLLHTTGGGTLVHTVSKHPVSSKRAQGGACFLQGTMKL